MATLDDFVSFLQGASNSAASNLSAPVDGINWLLGKAGLPVSKTPVGGSDWLRQAGFTAEPKSRNAALLGEAVGGVMPIVAAAKAPQIAAGLNQAGRNLAAPRTLNPQTGAIVWHGSPHKFDKFDSSKIGTGEGAQAYGHGLYLAENPSVAGAYKEALSEPELYLKNRQVKTGDGTPMYVAKAWLKDSYDKGFFNSKTASPFDNAIKQVQSAPVPNKDSVIAALKKLKDSGATMDKGGSLYKVDLPDDAIAKMLNWDKPLSEQPQEIQSIAKSLLGKNNNPMAWLVNDGAAQDMTMTGKQFLNTLIGGESQLQKAGIPGIRYLDGGSRGTGAGTSNFVVFPGNESLLSILERNGQPLR